MVQYNDCRNCARRRCTLNEPLNFCEKIFFTTEENSKESEVRLVGEDPFEIVGIP